MQELFLKILNMSVTASYVIIAVMFIRLLLKKAPKKYSYALWSVVAFRLCCPISFNSVFSIFNMNLFGFKIFDLEKAQSSGANVLEHIPQDIGHATQPQVNTGIEAANSIINEVLPVATPANSVNPIQIWIYAGTVIWCIGIIALLIYGIVTYSVLRKNMKTAVLLRDNIWQSDKVRSPFILGFVKPKIYIPFGLEKSAQKYVLAHEGVHLKRKDYIIKPLAFLILIIHWFNPLVWIAFNLMGKDMEMSCDERVLLGEKMSIAECSEAEKTEEKSIRKVYSTTLLSFAVNKRFPTPTPLTFGETAVKGRIKNVLNWKKPKLWVTVVAIIICSIIIIFCAANPSKATLYGESPFGVTYRVEKIVYDAPQYSSTYTEYNMPQYTLTADHMLMVKGDMFTYGDSGNKDEWITLGEIKNNQIKLTKENFDDFFIQAELSNGTVAGFIEDITVSDLRKNNKSAWKLANDNRLFYVLQQKNGDVYLASGYYNTESENDLELVNSVIRWLFKLEAVGDIVEDNSEGEVRDMVEADSENEVENQVVNRPLNIANEPLLEGLEEKYVIFHNLDVVSGQSLWEDFLRKTESEEPADVKLAYYYTLREASSYGAEYYEQIKDDYPVVYIKNLVYDGDSYIISESNGGEDYSKSYKYLMKYTGKPSSPTALFSYYTRYVLVNKDTYTWEELEASVYSSQLGAYIDHGTVYTDYIYK